jgi:hypothetical protein
VPVHALPHFRAQRPVFAGVAQAARRVRVWWRAPELDRQLAEGTHPWRSHELSLRARQLTATGRRARFASELESVVREACRDRRDRGACVPLQRSEVRGAADELLALATELSVAERCTPRSVALVSYLLYDPCSPLYYRDARVTAASIAQAARAGLES